MAKRTKKPNQPFSPWSALILLGSLILGGFLLLRQPSQQISINEVNNQEGSIVLALSPAALELAPNTESTLTLSIDTKGSRVSGVAVELDFEPNNLQVLEVNQGSFLANTLSSPKITGGQVAFTFAAPPDSGGIEGTGTLATIKIKSSAESARLSFTTQTQAYAVEHPTNWLKSASDANITVNSALPSASPSILPSPDPSSPADSADPADSANPITYNKTSLKLGGDPTCTNLSLAWDKVSNAPGYHVDISESANFTNYKSSGKLASSKSTHTFTGLTHNTRYYARITLADIPGFPQFSQAFEANTKNCSSNNTSGTSSTPTPDPTNAPAPTPSPTPSPSPTPKSLVQKIISGFSKSPSPKPSPSLQPAPSLAPPASPSPFDGSLNDIFTETPLNSIADSSEPGLLQKILLGWSAIFQRLFGNLAGN